MARLICKEGNVTCAVLCDGVARCSDGSDERNCASKGPAEDAYQICSNCAYVAKRCDGNYDCPGNICSLDIEDESTCDTFPFVCPNGQVLCDGDSSCATLCDCNDDCSTPKDEINCECESGYSTTGWLEIPRYDFFGTRIVKEFYGSVSDCKIKCLSTEGCLSFVYGPDAGACDLFGNTVFGYLNRFFGDNRVTMVNHTAEPYHKMYCCTKHVTPLL